MWSRLGQGTEDSIGMSRVPSSTEEVEELLAEKGVYTMASGDKPGGMKFFFFCKDAVGSTYLLQCTIHKAGSGLLEVVIKNDSPDPTPRAQELLELMKHTLAAYL
ncbi:unnamed protein product [Discosporangium mesarthrocarpum]